MCLVTCREKDIPKQQLLLAMLKVLKVFCLLFKGMRRSRRRDEDVTMICLFG